MFPHFVAAAREINGTHIHTLSHTSNLCQDYNPISSQQLDTLEGIDCGNKQCSVKSRGAESDRLRRRSLEGSYCSSQSGRRGGAECASTCVNTGVLMFMHGS